VLLTGLAFGGEHERSQAAGERFTATHRVGAHQLHQVPELLADDLVAGKRLLGLLLARGGGHLGLQGGVPGLLGLELDRE
jgi:hypothetical protein